MAEKAFNEAERYLIQNWTKARTLEESMDAVRQKYWGLASAIAEAVQAKNTALDWQLVYVHHTSGEGGIGIAKNAWPEVGGYKLGFYVANLRLELLAAEAEDENRPYACVWTKPASRIRIGMSEVNRAILAASRNVLTADERKRCEKEEEAPVWYYLPETREQLHAMLLEGDGQRFVECIVPHFELLTRFTPTLDKILSKAGGKK